ncbi:MAG: hypothetical protein AAB909_04845 [Patescibacteria group bacterium]
MRKKSTSKKSFKKIRGFVSLPETKKRALLKGGAANFSVSFGRDIVDLANE